VEPKEGMDSLHLPTKNTVKIVGGDSGGGLFDSSGRLVGFSPESSGLPDAPHEHVRIETLQAQQKDLRVPFERAARSEVMAVDAVLEASANRMRASTVEVLSDGKATALGTIVGGWNGSHQSQHLARLPHLPPCRWANSCGIAAHGCARTRSGSLENRSG
jgi:hypothetical protein